MLETCTHVGDLTFVCHPGGEFGAAMVYLIELANPKYKAVTGSIGYVSMGAGVVLGILVVTAIISLVPEGERLI